MRTTITISDGILAEVRERARRKNRPFREVLEDALQRGLGMGTDPGERVRLRTHRVGIKLVAPGESLNQLYDQIEAEDGAADQRP